MTQRKKTGGRKKGTPNKATIPARELADKLGINPLEVLLRLAVGDHKGLGMKDRYTGKGKDRRKVEIISVFTRHGAARDAAEYIFPKRKSVELTDSDGNNPFKSLVELVKELASDDKKPG